MVLDGGALKALVDAAPPTSAAAEVTEAAPARSTPVSAFAGKTKKAAEDASTATPSAGAEGGQRPRTRR